jgi:prepilin-type processing-associated H-X9-DG protein
MTKGSGKALGLFGAVSGVALLGLACLGCIWPVDLLFHLAAGWAMFLVQVAPQVAVSGEGILTAAVCLVLLTVGLHALAGWLWEQRQRAAPPDQDRLAWRWRWTLGLVGIVVLMFVAGISAVGVTHQTAWLLTSPEPATDGGIQGVGARMLAANRLKQIAVGLHDHHEQHGKLPAGGVFDARGRGQHGWMTFVLPHLDREEGELFRRIDLQAAWTDPPNVPHFRTVVRPYQAPQVQEREDDAGFALSHYAANAWVLGGDVPRSFKDIPDGLSNTLLLGEAAGNYKAWGHPTNWRDPAKGINTSKDGFGSPRGGGANFAFADGSVRFLKNDVHPDVLRALSTPDGGERMPDGEFP